MCEIVERRRPFDVGAPAYDHARRSIGQRERHDERLQDQGHGAGAAALGCLRHIEQV